MINDESCMMKKRCMIYDIWCMICMILWCTHQVWTCVVRDPPGAMLVPADSVCRTAWDFILSWDGDNRRHLGHTTSALDVTGGFFFRKWWVKMSMIWLRKSLRHYGQRCMKYKISNFECISFIIYLINIYDLQYLGCPLNGKKRRGQVQSLGEPTSSRGRAPASGIRKENPNSECIFLHIFITWWSNFHVIPAKNTFLPKNIVLRRTLSEGVFRLATHQLRIRDAYLAIKPSIHGSMRVSFISWNARPKMLQQILHITYNICTMIVVYYKCMQKHVSK